MNNAGPLLTEEFSWGFPRIYQSPIAPPKFVQRIVVNWLKIEISAAPEKEFPALASLAGWRNIEVFTYVQDTKGDWQRRLVQEMYH